METKIIELPFNYEDYINSQKTVWEYLNKKFIKSQSIYTVAALAFSTTIFISNNQQNHILANSILFGCAFYFLMGWIGFFERRTRFYKKIKGSADNTAIHNGNRFIFSDFGIEYEDQEKSFKLSWGLFRSPIIFKEYMLLMQKDALAVTFIFSKKELEDHPEINDSLNEKLGR